MAEDVKKLADDSKVAFQAGNYEEAAQLLGRVREAYPDAEQGPDGSVMVAGKEIGT